MSLHPDSQAVTHGEGGGVWLGAKEVAELTGLSYQTVLVKLRDGTLPSKRRHNWQYAVRRDDVQGWLDRARLGIGAASLRSAVPRSSNDGVELLTTILAMPGWTERRLAQLLGVKVAKLHGWPHLGVPNAYIPRLRALVRDPVDP